MSAEHGYLAKVAFETFWETFGATPMPTYAEASAEEKRAWEASVEAISLLVMNTMFPIRYTSSGGHTYVPPSDL